MSCHERFNMNTCGAAAVPWSRWSRRGACESSSSSHCGPPSLGGQHTAEVSITGQKAEHYWQSEFDSNFFLQPLLSNFSQYTVPICSTAVQKNICFVLVSKTKCMLIYHYITFPEQNILTDPKFLISGFSYKKIRFLLLVYYQYVYNHKRFLN